MIGHGSKTNVMVKLLSYVYMMTHGVDVTWL